LFFDFDFRSISYNRQANTSLNVFREAQTPIGSTRNDYFSRFFPKKVLTHRFGF